jgi:hypothetical protein
VKRSKKPMPDIELISYGKYTGWISKNKDLPSLEKLMDRIKAEKDMEFGITVEIRKAKGRYINYCIEHPPFRDENNQIIPPFSGEYQIRTNPARFFLGDCLVPPIEDKRGIWAFKILLDDRILIEKKIEIV